MTTVVGGLDAVSAPPPTGELAEDAATLTFMVHAAERALASLPARPDRDAEQERIAARLHQACRRSRADFLAVHAERVYDRVTAGRTTWPRLADVAYGAAEAFPGLVPTRAQIAQERQRVQAHKEGLEIDQGILFSALFRSPLAGAHLLAAARRPTPRALELLPLFRARGQVEIGVVRLERRGGAGHLTVCNVDCLNAEDDPSVDDMETAVDLVLLDDETQVGVLRGGPMAHSRYAGRRVFSAGINLKHVHDGQISYVDFLLRREVGYLSKIYRGLLTDPADGEWPALPREKPWIAAVDTFAIGGGMQVSLVCDWVIAGSDAYFSLPAANEGIVPGVSNLRLSRLVGARQARRIILDGRRILATDPEAALVCDEVVDPAAVDEAVEAAALRLGSPAVVANRSVLNQSDEPLERFREYLAEFAIHQALRLYSPDVLEKVRRSWSGRAGGR